MDAGRFDAVARTVAAAPARRRVILLVVGVALGALEPRRATLADCQVGGRCGADEECCRGERCTKRGRCACRGDRQPCVDRCCREVERCDGGRGCIRPGGACTPATDRCCDTSTCEGAPATEGGPRRCCLRPGNRCDPADDRCCGPLSTCTATVEGNSVCSEVG